MLQQYRYESFIPAEAYRHDNAKQASDHYGLALILVEGKLWDHRMYASMARSLNGYFKRQPENKYAVADYHAPTYLKSKHKPGRTVFQHGII